MSRLGQSINNYPNCIMLPLGEGKAGYKIHSNVIPLSLGELEGDSINRMVLGVQLLLADT